jgi:hypothetical protein
MRQPQIQRMGGMSSAVIGGFCEHSPVVLRRTRASGQVRRHDRQGNGEGARVAAQRGHSIPEAPTAYDSGWPQGHGATSTKTKSRACPTWTPAPNTHARFATSGPRTRGGEQRKPEHSRTPLGRRREWAAQQGATEALWRRPPAPAAWAAGERRGRPYVSASLTARAAATHR